MVGRQLIPEGQIPPHFAGRSFARRRAILRETLDVLGSRRQEYRRLAAENLRRWSSEAAPPDNGLEVRVIKGDWGQVTAELTREFGQTFAALNMANAYVPGGGYVEGCPAQEENMFRRTDCHYSVKEEDMDPRSGHYLLERSALISAAEGRVYLDRDEPRVCVRGPEDRQRSDLGYPWLAQEEVFPFYELRAAALDLRHGGAFDPTEARRRIEAQLDTLIDGGVRHVVLSAFGCGAFRNPAARVARIYRGAIEARREAFGCVAFAIFHPGYGPDNFTPFREAFETF